MRLFATILTLMLFITSCEEESYIPKPPSYLRLELPDHSYNKYEDDCNYSFNLPQIYTVTNTPGEDGPSCNKKIDLGPLNGTMFIRYWDMSEPIAYYINNANDEIGKHKVKATLIDDDRIIKTEKRVFGTIFELQGNVATPFQFYLTDSTNRFIYCEVLFNSTPNYDSIKPTLDYFRRDLDSLINSFEWEK